MHLDRISELLTGAKVRLEAFPVAALSVFGSMARGEANPGSDIDILVDFTAGASVGLFHYLELKEILEEIFGCPVDLVTRDALHPALREHILTEARRVA